MKPGMRQPKNVSGLTSNQFEIVIMHQSALITVSLNKCSLIHVQIKHSLAYLQDIIPTLAGGSVYYLPKYELNLVDTLENALFIHALHYM